MKSTYTNLEYQNKTYKEKYRKGLKATTIRENIRKIKENFAKGENLDICLNGVIISICEFQIEPPLFLNVEHDFPYIKVHFEIEGHSEYSPINSESIPVVIKNGHYNFFYLPKVNGTLTYNTPTRKSLEIVVTEAYLKNVFKNNFNKVSKDFGKALNGQIPFKMFTNGKEISSALLLIISDIISCSYQKEIKQVYLESKVKEVFSYLFSELSTESTEKKHLKPNNNECKQIINAEKILRQYIGESITIKELSVLSGMNQNKLKRHFKSAFGKPIFKYLTELRMETAKKMLIKNNMNVSEVAYAVGYKNHQHFTHAFKRKFNYLPRDLKTKTLLGGDLNNQL
ncbi:AraC family transcriptional regulator [Tenacibaculum finnmarkense]|uniref:helix-turn-helix domain-containing protein n=1 Tax=Tenacibaculum finnmarkense TaxID=2781243 RepID=UPI001E513694|nr:AraC family transcriptional regulator [Tenacibaculum finnmarkense]MCD8422293.1 AraC family transcriptional regulator [Tenacibaculum finnmarkense genomovar ulcerans]MCD8432331.1 AraC family transcriptional regulator [Tenacibaculum finnmarkense genomovar ulcerans]MCG8235856.1 helix-turn-helix transcriptional regulator [Tenacibaculum finnmarkense genomovar ulcerans]MCG8238298.1 helix-turn-helix transcriptional regulator [Tenacibaculum finnmarkense genomovar ulcerans]MCG8733577.1 helix-turn-hel